MNQEIDEMAKLKIETRRELAARGLHVGSLWQPPALFADDKRPLKNVAQPGDPWVAQLFYPDAVSETGPCRWHPLFIAWGQGETADKAVEDAMRNASGLQGQLRMLAGAIESLVGVMTRAEVLK